MIRILWVFLVLDIAVTAILLIGDFVTGATTDRGEIWLRVTIELAALAIIDAVRERKV